MANYTEYEKHLIKWIRYKENLSYDFISDDDLWSYYKDSFYIAFLKLGLAEMEFWYALRNELYKYYEKVESFIRRIKRRIK